MSKKILYIGDIVPDFINKNNLEKEVFPGSKKSQRMLEAMVEKGYSVEVISFLNTHTASNRFKIIKNTFSGNMEINSYLINITFPGFLRLPVIWRIALTITTLYQVIKKVSQENIDYIIFRNYSDPENCLPPLIAKLFFNLRIILQYEEGRCWDPQRGLSKLQARLFRAVTRPFVDGAIYNSKTLQEKDKNKNSTIFRGIVDKQNFILKRDSQKSHSIDREDKILIVFGGKLDKLRGVNFLINTIPDILQNCEIPVKFHICGYESESRMQEIEQKVHALGSNDVRFLGTLSSEDYFHKINSADILLNLQAPKINFPSKILEYMATGNLIITTPVSDLEDFADGKMLLLNKFRDKEELVNVLCFATANLEDLQSFGTSSQKWVFDTCSFRARANQLDNFLQDV